MTKRHHLPLTLLGLLAAGPALARPLPTPPPSGIVIHLFGPGSVTSHLLPGTSSPPAHAAQATGTATPPSTGTSPGWGSALHQMFVTGDPAQENGAGFAKGRAGQLH